jgi:hypothetical protein
MRSDAAEHGSSSLSSPLVEHHPVVLAADPSSCTRTGRVTSFPVVVADCEGERYLVAMLGEGAN